MEKIDNSLCDRRPIGANPRNYMGFKNQDAVKRHILKNQPRLYHCIGKIRTLKPSKSIVGSQARVHNNHLVYFKVRKK